MAGDDTKRLLEVLSSGDLELLFHDDRKIKVHSQKLKLASFNGILHQLMEDLVEDQIAKRRRTDAAAGPTQLKVRRRAGA